MKTPKNVSSRWFLGGGGGMHTLNESVVASLNRSFPTPRMYGGPTSLSPYTYSVTSLLVAMFLSRPVVTQTFQSPSKIKSKI